MTERTILTIDTGGDQVALERQEDGTFILAHYCDGELEQTTEPVPTWDQAEQQVNMFIADYIKSTRD